MTARRGAATAGYSGTPLVKKLGIEEGARVRLVGEPPHYVGLLEGVPPRVTFVKRAAKDLDLVHVFATEAAALGRALPRLKSEIAKDGALWVSWPKKAAKMATDLDEDRVRVLGLAAGLVDVKVCAVDATWSGLKFVHRLKDRGA